MEMITMKCIKTLIKNKGPALSVFNVNEEFTIS